LETVQKLECGCDFFGAVHTEDNPFFSRINSDVCLCCHVRFAEIWLMMMLMLKYYERKTLFVR
jgi:hypothetical protein